MLIKISYISIDYLYEQETYSGSSHRINEFIRILHEYFLSIARRA